MTDQEINEAVARKMGKGKDIDVHPSLRMGYQPFPNYCHSIAAAWEIIPKFNKPVDVCYCPGVIAEGDWSCCVGVTEDPDEDPNNPELEEWADTAPMAICLAFLKMP